MEMEMEMEMDGRNVQSEIEEHTVIVDIKDNKKDTPQLKRAMEDKLKTLSRISKHRCIYRVPKILRDTNEAAYVPRLVSLGPFHHGKEGLEVMEEHKWRCFESFIKEHEIDLDALLGLMKEHEEITREYYADRIALSSDEFVQVILVDAIFVIYFMLRTHSSDSAIHVESIYHEDFFWNKVSIDMMLLENQLPLFILEKILQFTYGARITEQCSVAELSIRLFDCHMIEEEPDTKLCNCLFNCHKKEGGMTDHESGMKYHESYDDARHFVDLQRLFYTPHEKRLTREFREIKSASKLHKAGVRFRLASAKRLLDIEFKDGVLEIPGIVMTDDTETIFRNLLAYVQCHHGPSRISDYFVLMGMLIDTADGVELLVKNNILHNDLATEQEVSKVFNSLEKEVVVNQDSFYYLEQCDKINEYCEIFWHKWMATLKQNYLDTPWKVISLIAAFILLVLTMIQTVFSVISP